MCVVPQHTSMEEPEASGKMSSCELFSANAVYLPQRLFVVPASREQKEIPFARVNHNKYMVTDRVAYIGNAPNATNLDVMWLLES